MADPAWGWGQKEGEPWRKEEERNVEGLRGRGRRGGREAHKRRGLSGEEPIGGLSPGARRLDKASQRHVHTQERVPFVPVLEPQPDPMSNGAAIFKNPNMVSRPSRILNSEIKSAPEC